MVDNAALNNKYFIDDKAFNCPFCGLRNTTYTVLAIMQYNLSKTKEGRVAFVRCNKCKKVSIHFLSEDISYPTYNSQYSGVVLLNAYAWSGDISFSSTECDIDSKIFHNIPSSYFTMDERIPKEMRKLFDEAQECKKANLKIGASACLRKLIYTLLFEQLNKKNGTIKQSLKDLGYEHYSDCIKALKEYHPTLEIFIEPLEDITGITSDQVHEASWSEISSDDITICLASIKDLLNEIYVHPAILKERRDNIIKMKEKALHKSVLTTNTPNNVESGNNGK